MRRRTLVAGLITSVVVIALAAPASAGGWWSYVDLDKRHVSVGDTLTSSTEVMFPTSAMARRARSGRYFAYLVRGIDQKLLDEAMSKPQPKRWWTQPETAVRAGKVRWRTRDSNIAHVIVNVTIPEVSPGRYALMLCDAGCRTPLGDVVPTEGLRVYAPDELAAARAAQAAADAERLRLDSEAMDQALGQEIDQVREYAMVAQADARRAADNAARAEQAVQRLEAQVAALSARDPAAPWPAAAGWAVAGLVGLLWLASALHRRRREEAPPPAPEVAADDEWEYAGRR